MARWIPLFWRLVFSRLGSLIGRGLYSETHTRRVRSLFLRHLDGGSSNIYELELTALNNPFYDLAQYGIRFVAAPRHADILVVTGPLTRNMLQPAFATFCAMPEPRRVLTMGPLLGPCADAGTPRAVDTEGHVDLCALFADSYAIVPLPAEMLRPACHIAHIPHDPPAPDQILAALLTIESI